MSLPDGRLLFTTPCGIRVKWPAVRCTPPYVWIFFAKDIFIWVILGLKNTICWINYCILNILSLYILYLVNGFISKDALKHEFNSRTFLYEKLPRGLFPDFCLSLNRLGKNWGSKEWTGWSKRFKLKWTIFHQTQWSSKVDMKYKGPNAENWTVKYHRNIYRLFHRNSVFILPFPAVKFLNMNKFRTSELQCTMTENWENTTHLQYL